MATYKGLDVSYSQGNIDFKKVKADGYTFVIIQAGYGRLASQKDKYFEQNYKNAKAAGLNVGAYWFSYAESAEDAKLEAKACMEVIKGKKFEYPIFFDLEGAPLQKGKAECSKMIDNFCTALQNNGWYVGLYMSRSALQTLVTDTVAKKYTKWIAEYGVNKPQYEGSYGMWQYSDKGQVKGITNNVDLDTAYKDYAKIIKEGGYNGFKKPTLKTLDATGYKKGQATIGVLAFKQLLIAAKAKKIITQGVNNDNKFGDGTEKAVNELLGKWGYRQNGIAGENMIKKLGELLKK